MRQYLLIVLLVIFTGCARVPKAVHNYYAAYDHIQLGDSKAKVLSLLEPDQQRMGFADRKPQERFSRDGHIYDIYYARSAYIPDGETTDDEFTPYIFKDGILLEIGWEFLGGPQRTSAEVAREHAEVEKAKASAPRIETTIKQSTRIDTD
ncbi:MAG: DUF3192 domain-containing protein [Candidatus Omnitrophica bacterium]|nr:DUF3192 domain-containing protein [Candidatus Omnitrophota bacterium]